MNKWTPGPWRAVPCITERFDKEWGRHTKFNGRARLLTHSPIPSSRNLLVVDEQEGPAFRVFEDAQLAAAAPSLYNALEQAEAYIESLISAALGNKDITNQSLADNANAVLDMANNALALARCEVPVRTVSAQEQQREPTPTVNETRD